MERIATRRDAVWQQLSGNAYTKEVEFHNKFIRLLLRNITTIKFNANKLQEKFKNNVIIGFMH